MPGNTECAEALTQAACGCTLVLTTERNRKGYEAMDESYVFEQEDPTSHDPYDSIPFGDAQRFEDEQVARDRDAGEGRPDEPTADDRLSRIRDVVDGLGDPEFWTLEALDVAINEIFDIADPETPDDEERE